MNLAILYLCFSLHWSRKRKKKDFKQVSFRSKFSCKITITIVLVFKFSIFDMCFCFILQKGNGLLLFLLYYILHVRINKMLIKLQSTP